jgi:hypothetical protein
MKRWFLLVCLLFSALSIEAREDVPITRELVVKAIAFFRQDPTSEMGRAAQSVVVKFSRDSPDVQVLFTAKNYPISEISKASEEVQMALIAAFVVGNVDSQLRPGHEKKEDSYAGDLQLIRTYRQLQQKDRKLKIPAIEKMADMEARGELKRYLAVK